MDIITEKIKKIFPDTLRTRTAVLFMGGMLAALVLMCAVITNTVSGKLYANYESDLFTKANIIAENAIHNEDTEEILKSSLAGSNIRGMLLDSAGEAVADSNPDAKADGIVFTSPVIFSALSGTESSLVHKNETGIKTLSAAVPIIEDDTITGAVFLSRDMNDTDRLVSGILMGLILFSAVIMVLVILLSTIMSSMITTPLNDFVTAVQEISKGNFDKKIPVRGNSEMDQLANAINYMSTELEHLEAKRRKFVSDASHELKTPMATIKLICDSITVSDTPDPAMVKEFLGDLSDEVDRLTRIIEKLLLLTKLDSKETDLSPELVDFGMMLSRIKASLTPLAAGKNITISTDIPADLPPVSMDYDRIWESVYNMVDNAIKYSKIGTLVKLSVSAEETGITLRIYDSGKGIPDEFKERVFERFYRLDDSRTRETGGTGLGLAIAKEAVLLHNGKLYVEDNPEGGSCFVMTLPLGTEPQNGGASE